jgi:ubiquinone/menaquinone biosynthesis C-methylase UbiE
MKIVPYSRDNYIPDGNVQKKMNEIGCGLGVNPNIVSASSRLYLKYKGQYVFHIPSNCSIVAKCLKNVLLRDYEPMSKIEDWIDRQTRTNMAQWDKSIENHYPQYTKMWRDPAEHYRCLKEYWNCLDAVKTIDWSAYFKRNNLALMDLGAGTGWLSAYLSTFDQVNKIFAVDSSYFLLHDMFDEIVKLMSGKREKITTVQGLFTPILLDDKSLDVVVISSALHHAENLEDTLKEIYRLLKDDGYLFILNETPYTKLQYAFLQLKIAASLLKNSIFQKYAQVSQSQSSSGVITDPYLGDHCYPLWFWIKAIQKSSFKVERIVRTRFYSRKNEKTGNKLTHFVCKKNT